MATIEQLQTLTEALAEATEEYRHDRSDVDRDRDLTPEARERRAAECRDRLARIVQDTVQQVEPGLSELEQQSEVQLRGLALDPEVRAAVSRVTYALQTTHPADLVQTYTADQDGPALLALRQLVPSIAGNYADHPDSAQQFAEAVRDRIDHHLARVGVGAAGESARQKAKVRSLADRYRSTAFYAVNPSAEGALARALGDAAERADREVTHASR